MPGGQHPRSPLSALPVLVSGVAGRPRGAGSDVAQVRFREARRRSPALPLTDCRFSSFLSQEPAGQPWAPCYPHGPSSIWAMVGEGVGRGGQPLALSALSLEAGLPPTPDTGLEASKVEHS